MGRWIQFAIGRRILRSQGSGLKVPGKTKIAGVYIGSGIGGFEVIERVGSLTANHPTPRAGHPPPRGEGE